MNDDEYHPVKSLIEIQQGFIIYACNPDNVHKIGSAIVPYRPKSNPNPGPRRQPKQPNQRKSKREILFDENPHCKYCSILLRWDNFTLDHIVSRSRGGSNDISNLVVCCFECNNKKGSKSLKDFLKELEDERKIVSVSNMRS